MPVANETDNVRYIVPKIKFDNIMFMSVW